MSCGGVFVKTKSLALLQLNHILSITRKVGHCVMNHTIISYSSPGPAWPLVGTSVGDFVDGDDEVEIIVSEVVSSFSAKSLHVLIKSQSKHNECYIAAHS